MKGRCLSDVTTFSLCWASRERLKWFEIRNDWYETQMTSWGRSSGYFWVCNFVHISPLTSLWFESESIKTSKLTSWPLVIPFNVTIHSIVPLKEKRTLRTDFDSLREGFDFFYIRKASLKGYKIPKIILFENMERTDFDFSAPWLRVAGWIIVKFSTLSSPWIGVIFD